jgi:hypothetical protein
MAVALSEHRVPQLPPSSRALKQTIRRTSSDRVNIGPRSKTVVLLEHESMDDAAICIAPGLLMSLGLFGRSRRVVQQPSRTTRYAGGAP